MAQFLIRIVDRTAGIRADALARVAKRGDPIVAKADDAPWGIEEDKRVWIARKGSDVGWPGTFVILKITDMGLAEALQYLTRQYRDAELGDAEFTATDLADRRVLVRHHQFNFDLDTFRPGILNELNIVGYAETTWANINGKLVDKVTDSPIVRD